MADGIVVEGPIVVETDDDGRIVGCHLLVGEEAGTVWHGGEIQINLK